MDPIDSHNCARLSIFFPSTGKLNQRPNDPRHSRKWQAKTITSNGRYNDGFEASKSRILPSVLGRASTDNSISHSANLRDEETKFEVVDNGDLESRFSGHAHSSFFFKFATLFFPSNISFHLFSFFSFCFFSCFRPLCWSHYAIYETWSFWGIEDRYQLAMLIDKEYVS